MDTPQGGSDPVESNPSSSPVFIVSNFWKELDLEKEKSLLDGQGLRIAENLENSQKNRRKLAESTRDFKKASAEEKSRLFNSLLKGYQEEIDNLTKRAKFGENEAPDPYPGLASITEVVIEGMKKELQTRPTEKLVEGLRKKVKILQAVGYNSVEAEDWEAATSGEEVFLVKLSEKISLLETDDGKIRELTEKVNEQQKLIQKLEDDILKGYSSKEWKGTLFDDWDISESTGNELSEKNIDQKQVSSDKDQTSMLKVICNQRNRFRARNKAIKGEDKGTNCRPREQKLTTLNFMERFPDYNQEKVISRGLKKYAEDLESGFSSDVDSKYKKMYEDDINPFAAFSRKHNSCIRASVLHYMWNNGTYVFGSIEDSDETKLKYYFPR
ncbi:hypothetical protein Goari_007721 [Gossypium aridum]|uniref:Protein CASP n=1 Tax=Gossypium aridum TaxID=34290 RepID=A0A7J8XRZ3_GOSAI|nr:hypothetical protein [Gossypium aridum]